MRIALGLATLLMLTGCGSDESPDGGEASEKEVSETFTVVGTLKVDDLYTVRVQGAQCQAPEVESRSVVVSAPDGTEVGLADLGQGQSLTTKNGKFYVPGVCEFSFAVPDLPVTDGVFTVELEGTQTADRVTADDSAARLTVS